MNNTEMAFFGLAIMLPLVGGSTLLYLLSRDAKKAAAEKNEKERPDIPPQ